MIIKVAQVRWRRCEGWSWRRSGWRLELAFDVSEGGLQLCDRVAHGLDVVLGEKAGYDRFQICNHLPVSSYSAGPEPLVVEQLWFLSIMVLPSPAVASNTLPRPEVWPAIARHLGRSLLLLGFLGLACSRLGPGHQESNERHECQQQHDLAHGSFPKQVPGPGIWIGASS